MIRQRARAVRFAVAALAAVTLVVGWVLIREWMELPGVPADVVSSVESEQVRVLAEGSESSPGNDWDNSYALISVSSQKDPVDEIEAALQSAGWTTRLGVSDPLLLAGDSSQRNPEYGVTVQTYENFDCLDRSGVCGTFEKAAGSQGRNLFVATFMPYV
ncbi:hypothetical protein HLK59_27315 [Streptomyces sp. S3(2020)]|uniref:hypothetical protein n=1 Tax=Streptomyces sp. S3(2020) TaxID=2732044 RepID=UPI00148991D0|nr:hypothetical protein [Streptomyces sp. S3(2020)]NNN34006.1 hypothetical protein [Streptomyces sp. S3(2020)]